MRMSRQFWFRKCSQLFRLFFGKPRRARTIATAERYAADARILAARRDGIVLIQDRFNEMAGNFPILHLPNFYKPLMKTDKKIVAGTI